MPMFFDLLHFLLAKLLHLRSLWLYLIDSYNSGSNVRGGIWIQPLGCRSNMFFISFVGIQPWEERIVSAQEQGTLVQLSNLDPTCTSKQVEVMSILCDNVKRDVFIL